MIKSPFFVPALRTAQELLFKRAASAEDQKKQTADEWFKAQEEIAKKNNSQPPEVNITSMDLFLLHARVGVIQLHPLRISPVEVAVSSRS